MYKVFFNASCFTLCSKNENSFKSNKAQFIEIQDASVLFDCVADFESKNTARSFSFVSELVEKIWTDFVARFVVIDAAGGIVQNEKQDILVINRLGKWDLPKGKLEKNETAAEAAVREVQEECGLSELDLVKKVGSSWHMYRSPFHLFPDNLVLKETHWFAMKYRGGEKPTPQLEEEIIEARWLKQSEMDLFFENTYPSLIDLMQSFLSAEY